MTAAVCTTPGCGRPCNGAYLCTTHTTDLRRRLHRIAELADELPDTITRLARIGARSTGSASAETPLPWNEQAVRTGQRVQRILESWALHVAGHRQVLVDTTIGPTCEHCTHPSCRAARNYREFATAVTPSGRWARYLAVHFVDIRRTPEIGGLDAAAERCLDMLDTVIDRARQRVYHVGPCTEKMPDDAMCDGTLHALIREADQLLPSELVCDACGFTLPASKFASYGRKLGKLKRARTRAGKVVA